MKFDYLSLVTAAHYHKSEFVLIEEKLRDGFIKNKALLDVGFGQGKYLDLAKSIGYRTFGVEVNHNYIELSKNNGHECFHISELEKIDTRFDVILMSHIIEHLQHSEIISIIEKYINLLCDNGILIIASPVLGERFYYDITHIRPYYPQSIWHAFGNNNEELSISRSGVKIKLKEIHYIKDSYRIRNTRSYYIRDGLSFSYYTIKVLNYLLALIYLMSCRRIGIKASWIGIYMKEN